MISLNGLDRAAVLAALFNAATARAKGIWGVGYDPSHSMQPDEARRYLLLTNFMGNWLGRSIYILIPDEDVLDPHEYDDVNGQGAAARAIASLRLCAV